MDISRLRAIVVSDWKKQTEYSRETLDERCPEKLYGRAPILENYEAIALYLFRSDNSLEPTATLKISATFW